MVGTSHALLPASTPSIPAASLPTMSPYFVA
eukprot:CAMPEP_0115488642 /NCGR_PEP_ID=MMETSP0271-20121206/61588_1 /TAXON_ID=71861 /ORGANISM="Scrippsiella trochoidea, Strain CCMP3099" /LENGTH=30 /DNA_ID= /DNA_START= /DNA_END= /DNA_ORIENTATION=